MSVNSVVVHDVNELNKYGYYLGEKYEEISEIYSSLLKATEDIEDYWNDPQYVAFKDKITEWEKASESQLEDLNNTIDYIKNLVYKLRDL